jgi:hypothetical protein
VGGRRTARAPFGGGDGDGDGGGEVRDGGRGGGVGSARYTHDSFICI